MYGLSLEKQSFWDSLYIRCNIPLKNIPSLCVCGAAFKLEHALSYSKGGSCQSGIKKLENLQLNYYRNAAKMSQQSLYYNSISGSCSDLAHFPNPSRKQTKNSPGKVYFFLKINSLYFGNKADQAQNFLYPLYSWDDW